VGSLHIVQLVGIFQDPLPELLGNVDLDL